MIALFDLTDLAFELIDNYSNYYLVDQEFFDLHHVPYAPFYRYSMSELLLEKRGLNDVIKGFFKEKNIKLSYAFYRYAKDKLRQYTTGVRL